MLASVIIIMKSRVSQMRSVQMCSSLMILSLIVPTELGSRVFDRVEMKYRKDYRLLILGWSDGNTFLPINNCLLTSAKQSNIIGPTNSFDKRSIAGRHRKLTQMKAYNECYICLIPLFQTAYLPIMSYLTAGLQIPYRLLLSNQEV